MRHTLGVSEHDDDLDRLLRALPAAPGGWVSRAEELPLLVEAAESLSSEDDPTAFRAALVDVGLEPDDDRVRALERIVRRASSS